MTSCATMTAARDLYPRPPTPTTRPRSASVFRIITKKSSYQSLNSPILMSPMSPASARPFSAIETKAQDSPRWQDINVISPSTASHRSLYSDNEDGFRSPRLQLLTSNLLGTHSQCSSPGVHTLISPSAQVQLPGDELLYDVTAEKRPDEKIFDTAFQAALASAKQEMKDVSLALWGCPSSHQLGSDLHALKERAQELSEFEPSRTRTVGLVGDPGTGKSSVINSLLDQPYLAQSNFIDECSTSIITEYRFRPAHFNEPFSIEVDYMTVEEIRELIDELLRTFRACYTPAIHDVQDIEERQEIRLRSEKAWRTLGAMYRNQSIFTKEFLLEYPSNVNTPLSKVLEQWSATFLARRPGGSECIAWASTAFTVDEATDKLNAFTFSPIDNNTPALWPYVRVVRVYLRASLLQSGLILVDCPTPRDLNFARSRATERYLRNCHEIFAVTTMGRAATDKGIQDIVRRNNLHRPLRIICTKSEELNVREIERKGPEVSLQVRTWRQQIEGLQKQVKRNEAQRRHGRAGAAEEELRSRDLMHDLEFGLKKFLIERRNRGVATQLIDKYASEVQDGDLKIFCVSNKDYTEHRYDEKSRAESRLELTGIINLRKYCHSIPAGSQFEAICAFIEHEVPTFLGSLRQWAVSGMDTLDSARASELRQLMQRLEEIAIRKLVLPSAQIQITRTNLNHEFADSVTLPIREHRSEWRNAAIDVSKKWTKLPTKDYAAFCRHHGAHTLRTSGLRNWNSEIISPMRQSLESNWDFFAESIEDSKTILLNSIHEVCNEISAPLKERLEESPTALMNIINNMDSRSQNIQHIITTGFADILEGTQQLESDALHGHASSYINALMVPAYNVASLISSTEPDPTPSLATVSSSTRNRSPSSSSMSRSLSVSTASSIRSRSMPPPTPTSSAADTAPAPRSRSRAPSVSTSNAASTSNRAPSPVTTAPSPSVSQSYDQRLKDSITTHIASTRLFPKLASMIERSHRAFLRAAFDSMIASVTREVDALIRDLGLVVPPEDLESPSISRREEGDGNGGLEGAKESWMKVVRVGKSEAQKYEDFSSLLRGRIAQAEKVVMECKKVVKAVRRGEEVPVLVKKGEERVD